ncbi:MAG TPA: hypothetical protein VJ934_06425, partial [Desulfomicrobiaceae bacterium]|nr:hypothetical protein [Desulfomicrobiaceae bacterium]
MKRMTGLAGVILLVITGAVSFAAWYVLHSDLIDDKITALLQRQLGMPVRVSGPVDLQVFPVPGISLGDVHLGGDGTGGPGVRVRRISAFLEPWPLLSGRVVLRGCDLVGPQVTLQGGQTLADEKGRQGTSENSSFGSATSGIDFRKVRVLDGSVAWTGKGGTMVRLREISILPESTDGERVGLAGTLLVASSEDGPVLAQGNVQLSCVPRLGALTVLEEMRFSFAGSAGISRLPLKVQGAGRVDLSEQSLELAELSVLREEFEFLAGVQAERKGEEWILFLNDLRLNGRQLPGEVTLSGTGTDPHVAVRCRTMDFSLWQDLF